MVSVPLIRELSLRLVIDSMSVICSSGIKGGAVAVLKVGGFVLIQSYSISCIGTGANIVGALCVYLGTLA